MRITKENINYYKDIVNEQLKENNTRYYVQVNKRNGYYAIDLYNRDNTIMICCLYAGLTARECYLHIKGMQVGINLLNDMK